MMSSHWRLVRSIDPKHGTHGHALTNGRARLSIWVGELNDKELEALDQQLKRGEETLEAIENDEEIPGYFYLLDEDGRPCGALSWQRIAIMLRTAGYEVMVQPGFSRHPRGGPGD